MAEEKLNQDQQSNAEIPAENIVGQAGKIMETAMAEVKNNEVGAPKNGGDQKTMLGDSNDNTVAEKMKGLPMRELIAAPLLAAAEAQQELASVAWDFYQRIAFNDKEIKQGDKVVAKKGDTRILQFKVNRPVQEGGHTKMVEQTIQAPFIGLVPIPSLLIDRIDVDFQMEVTDTETSNTKTEAEVTTSVSSNWFVKANISGKVSTSRENTRSTTQTAKYQVHVSASQQPQTEGLSKLMDIMASCIEPITAEETGGGGSQ